MAGAPNIEVPLEFTTYGADNPASTTRVDFRRRAISLDPADYTGDTVAFYFESVGFNNTGQDVYLYLHNETDGTDIDLDSVGKQVVANSGTTSARRRTAAFTPTTGRKTYVLGLQVAAGTPTIDTAKFFACRIVVVITGATKARIQIPLITQTEASGSSLDASVYSVSRSVATYGVPGATQIGLWKKTAADWPTLTGTPWTFEAVIWCSTAGSLAYAALGDAAADATVVTGTEVSTTNATPTLLSASFADDAANFTDGHAFTIQAKAAAGKACRINGAALYLTITDFSQFEVYWAVGWNLASGTTLAYDLRERAALTSVNYGGAGYAATYFTDATGSSASGASTVALYDLGASASSTSGTLIASSNIIQGATRGLLRSSAWSSPTSGHDICGVRQADATGGAHSQIVATVHMVYTAPSGGCPKMTDHYARLRR